MYLDSYWRSYIRRCIADSAWVGWWVVGWVGDSGAIGRRWSSGCGRAGDDRDRVLADDRVQSGSIRISDNRLPDRSLATPWTPDNLPALTNRSDDWRWRSLESAGLPPTVCGRGEADSADHRTAWPGVLALLRLPESFHLGGRSQQSLWGGAYLSPGSGSGTLPAHEPLLRLGQCPRRRRRLLRLDCGVGVGARIECVVAAPVPGDHVIGGALLQRDAVA